MTLYRDEGFVGTDQFQVIGSNGAGHSDAARLTSGGFVVVWSLSTNLQFQIYDANGRAVGSVGSVTGQPDVFQQFPSVTALSNGGFAVGWQAADGNLDGVYAQTFDASGMAASGLFLAHDYIQGRQSEPELVGLTDGTFVVIWTDQVLGAPERTIFGRHFSSNGASMGDQFIVESFNTFNLQLAPSATALSDGGFAVAWGDEPTQSVRLGLFDANGTPRGPDVAVSTENLGAQAGLPATATTSGGSVVVTWTIDGQVKMRLFDASGSPLTAVVDVADWSGAKEMESSVAALDGGRFVVTYTASIAAFGPGNQFDVFSQHFDAAGNRIGGPVLVNQVTDNAQGFSQAVGFGTGDFAVTWSDVGQNPVYSTIATGSLSERLFFSADILGSGSSANVPTPGRDFVFGGVGMDVLTGAGGDDEMTGGSGADAFDGGSGLDAVRYDDSDAPVFVNLSTGQGNGNFAAGDSYVSIEKVVGSLGNDTLVGSAGNDILVGALGADTLVGGAGVDTSSYEDNGGPVFVNLFLRVGSGNAAEGDTYDGIENVRGTVFADFIIGDSGANKLEGGFGNDILIGAMGADALVGGPGNDTASYEDNYGAVFINLAAGRGYGNAAEGDTYESIEILKGSIYDDYLLGDANQNVLMGHDGNDVLIGGRGDDLLDGGAGSDTASYEDNYGRISADLRLGRSQGFVFVDGEYLGQEGDGFASIENLTGSHFGDDLKGDDGPNRLDGRFGADYLTGRGGADVIVFSTAPGPNTPDGFGGFLGNVDTLQDFEPGVDSIELHASVFTGLSTGALPAGSFVLGASALDADDRIIYDRPNGDLYFDPDGSGPADQILFAAFRANFYPQVTATDFIIV